MDKIDKKRFNLGAGLAISGVIIIIISLFIPPVGEIHPTAMGAVGEIFLLAGCLLGLDSYWNYKMKRIITPVNENKTEE